MKTDRPIVRSFVLAAALTFDVSLPLAAQHHVTAILEIPLGPMVYFMSVMLAVTGLVYLWLAREQLRRDD